MSDYPDYDWQLFVLVELSDYCTVDSVRTFQSYPEAKEAYEVLGKDKLLRAGDDVVLYRTVVGHLNKDFLMVSRGDTFAWGSYDVLEKKNDSFTRGDAWRVWKKIVDDERVCA